MLLSRLEQASTVAATESASVCFFLAPEVDEFTLQVMKWNAIRQHRGREPLWRKHNDSNDTDVFVSDPYYFIHDRLKPRTLLNYQQSIPLVCDSTDTIVQPGDQQCEYHNQFSYDGVHGCMESMAGRLAANWACLLSCVYNNNSDDNTHAKSNDDLRRCEQTRNDQYMSFKRIPNATVGAPLS